MPSNRRAVGSAILLTFLTLLTGCGAGGVIKQANLNAPSNTGLTTASFTNEGRTRNYSIFLPHAYDASKKWPTIVFLHGIGESGRDGTSCLKVGLAPAIAKRASDFPFIAIFPQSTGDWDEDEEAAADAIALLDHLKTQYAIDPNRITLTGLSTGGYGTWAIGAAYKNRFAALVPMCAYKDYKDVPKLTDIPIWCWHNSGDPFVFSSGSEEMVKRINAAGGHAKYTEVKALGHDVWIKAYDDPALFQWMLEQRRGGVTK